MQWLMARGGNGTDYCKTFALHNNSLYAFGWCGGQMEFFETVLKSNSGYTFWLAKFDLAKFEYMGSPKR